jgi:hypothetical protein
MWCIWVTPAARIHHVSRIHHSNGTLAHYRGLRDDDSARASRAAAAAAHTALRRPESQGRVPNEGLPGLAGSAA